MVPLEQPLLMSNHPAALDFDRVFDALGEPVRREIVACLRRGPTPVGKLADQLTVGRPAVSKHLRVLEGAGLVRHESRGTRNLYALAPEGMVVAQQWLVGMWDTALASFADAVQEAAGGPAPQPPDVPEEEPGARA